MICRNHGMDDLACLLNIVPCEHCNQPDACCGHKLGENCSNQLGECSVCRAKIVPANRRLICKNHGLLACFQAKVDCENCKQPNACCGYKLCKPCGNQLNQCIVCRGPI